MKNIKKSKISYKIIGFKENFYGSNKILLELKKPKADRSVFCFLKDAQKLRNYLSREDNNYLNILYQARQ